MLITNLKFVFPMVLYLLKHANEFTGQWDT